MPNSETVVYFLLVYFGGEGVIVSYLRLGRNKVNSQVLGLRLMFNNCHIFKTINLVNISKPGHVALGPVETSILILSFFLEPPHSSWAVISQRAVGKYPGIKYHSRLSPR